MIGGDIMKRLKQILIYLIQGMSTAVLRFPLTVLSLLCSATLICYEIYRSGPPGLLTQKLIATFIVAAVLGMSAQFAWESFEKLQKYLIALYLGASVLAVGYFLIILPAPEITAEIGIRTAVAVFALICSVLFLPTIAKEATHPADFNRIALAHFKSVFTSILFSAVLSGGLAAIIAAVDFLLFKLNSNTYSYMLTIVWVLFATIYYLSLLPNFNLSTKENLKLDKATSYPRFLEILISYIAIPLISTYTVVLIAYFIKILVTLNWPNGQVAVMVLVYTACGLVAFVLASSIDNKFNAFYQRVFPKMLFPLVVMQLVSVYIRINAYGITESRYYVVLFGIFSLAISIVLSIWPKGKNRYIALIAAIIALLSIIPPLDAFTVSRNSQITRVEIILQEQNILKNNQLYPKTDVELITKAEVTNILSYLSYRSSLKYIKWLPKNFDMYKDMEKVIGFAPEYNNANPDASKYLYISIDAQKPLDIAGYEVITNLYTGRFDKVSPNMSFSLKGKNYVIGFDRKNNNESIVFLKDDTGKVLNSINLYEKAKALIEDKMASKELVSPQLLTFDSLQNGYKMRIIFLNINGTLGTNTDAGFDYGLSVLIATP